MRRLVLGLGAGRGLGKGVNGRPLKEETTWRWRSRDDVMSGRAQIRSRKQQEQNVSTALTIKLKFHKVWKKN